MPSSGRRLLADTDTGFVKSRGAENVLNCLPRQRSSTRLTPGPGSRRQDLHSSCARCLSSHRRNLIITCSLCGFRVHGSCAYPPVNNAVAKLVASKSVGWHCWACKQEAAILQQFDITVRSCKKRWADEFCQDCGELAGAPSVNCEVCHSAFHRTCVREFEQRDGWRCRPCRPRDADPAVTMDKWAVELVCEADRYIPVIRGVNLSQPSQPWRTSEVVFRLSRAVLITRTGRIVRLRGPHNQAVALQLGFPSKLRRYFATGFPRHWSLLLKYARTPLPGRITETLDNRTVTSLEPSSHRQRPRRSRTTVTRIHDRSCVSRPDFLGQLLNLPDRSKCTTEQPPKLVAGGSFFLPTGSKVQKLFVQGWLSGVVVDAGSYNAEDVVVVLCEDCRFLTLSAHDLAAGLKSGQVRVLDTAANGEIAGGQLRAAPACSEAVGMKEQGWTGKDVDLVRSAARHIPAAAKDFWQQVAARVGKPAAECQRALDGAGTPSGARSKGECRGVDTTPQLQRGSGPRRFKQIRRFLSQRPRCDVGQDDFVMVDGLDLGPPEVAHMHTGATPRAAADDVECFPPRLLASPGIGSCDDLLGGTRHASVDSFMYEAQARRRQAKRKAAERFGTPRKMRILDCGRRVLSMLRSVDASSGEGVVDEDGFETVAIHNGAAGALLSV